MKITIEKGSDLFAAWADDVPGIYGEGASVKEVKEDILIAVELYKANNEDKNIPAELKGEIHILYELYILYIYVILNVLILIILEYTLRGLGYNINRFHAVS